MNFKDYLQGCVEHQGDKVEVKTVHKHGQKYMFKGKVKEYCTFWSQLYCGERNFHASKLEAYNLL